MNGILFETIEYLVIAFISSAILIFLSKIVLQAILRRPRDYYREEELRQEEMMLNSAGFSIKDELETNPEGELTSEHIHAEPQISVEEALKMHLADPDKIPNILKREHIRTEVPECDHSVEA